MNLLKDERITSQANKIGNESFFILVGMLFINMIYKAVINDMSFADFQWELILIMVSFSYYTLRCIIAGIYVMPSAPQKRNKFIRSLLIWLALGSTAWGLLLAIRNMFLYQDGVFNWLTLMIFLISSVSFFVVLLVAFIVFYLLSGAKANKSNQE